MKKSCCTLWLPAAIAAFAFGCGSFAGDPVLEGTVDLPEGTGPAVVFVRGASGAVPPDSRTVITHVHGGAFEPSVSVGYVGGEFVLRNEDESLHTTHLYLHLAYQAKLSERPIENGATLYNIALPRRGMEVSRPIKSYHQFDDDSGFIDVRCNPHPDERAAVLVFDHPYAAVTGPDGGFVLENIPPGTHELWIWHDGEARIWQEVDVKASGPTRVSARLRSGSP